MVIDSRRLEEALRTARSRVVSMIGVLSVLMLLITVKMIASRSSLDFRELAGWFFTCAVFAVFATIWYRARMNTIGQLRNAANQGVSIRDLVVSRRTVNYVPCGYEVELKITEPTGAVHISFGFWTREAAERLAGVLRGDVVAPPHAAPAEVPRAVVVSSANSPRGNETRP
jgi:hypothetical protein